MKSLCGTIQHINIALNIEKYPKKYHTIKNHILIVSSSRKYKDSLSAKK